MKKLIRLLALSLSFGYLGCGGEDTTAPAVEPEVEEAPAAPTPEPPPAPPPVVECPEDG